MLAVETEKAGKKSRDSGKESTPGHMPDRYEDEIEKNTRCL